MDLFANRRGTGSHSHGHSPRGSLKGFIFSFDAYVAFMLTVVIIYGMFLFITFPQGYYYEFEQTYAIAKDLVYTMGHSSPGGGYSSYNQLLAQDINSGGSASCDEVRKFVPLQYAFQVAAPSRTVCSRASEYDPGITCDGYRKAKVTVPLMLVDYGVAPDSGFNPYGYHTCGAEAWVENGIAISPCNVTYSNYEAGEVEMGVVNISICI